MRYRRDETLRYVFDQPLHATYQIIKIAGKSVQSSQGNARVLDLSPGGIKLEIGVNIPLNREVQFLIKTEVGQVPITITANGVWNKPYGNKFHYGLDFLEDYNEEVVRGLKEYQKRLLASE